MPNFQWFSLNRENGGPAYFGEQNRTVAAFGWNQWLFGVVITIASFLTILIILSPAFKYKWKTLALVTTDLLMGGAFAVALVMPWWHTTGSVRIRSPIKVHDSNAIDLTLTVNIGLDHVNITLLRLGESSSIIKRQIILPRLMPRDSFLEPAVHQHTDFQFNERVELATRDIMKSQLKKALLKGLPVPILTVVQYFCHQEEGFRWSFHYRQAGYFCQFTLTLTLICWAWMNVFFMVIPRYGAVAMVIMGSLGLLSVFLYWLLLPPKALVIHLNGSVINFDVDGCFWTALSTGAVAFITGTVLYFIDVRYPGSLMFDLEIDNDSPRSIGTLDKSLLRLQPADNGGKKLVLKPRMSLVHSSGNVSKPENQRQDSGISTNEANASKIDTTSVLEQIATYDGSYYRSTVTNLIHTQAPRIYSYTFRQGRELPSFHESTISLNSDTVPRFVDSASEELNDKKHGESFVSSSSDRDEWQDPLQDEPNQAIIHTACDDYDDYDDYDDHDDTFCSTLSSTTAITGEPSPRRRAHRAPSLGSHWDIAGSS